MRAWHQLLERKDLHLLVVLVRRRFNHHSHLHFGMIPIEMPGNKFYEDFGKKLQIYNFRLENVCKFLISKEALDLVLGEGPYT